MRKFSKINESLGIDHSEIQDYLLELSDLGLDITIENIFLSDTGRIFRKPTGLTSYYPSTQILIKRDDKSDEGDVTHWDGGIHFIEGINFLDALASSISKLEALAKEKGVKLHYAFQSVDRISVRLIYPKIVAHETINSERLKELVTRDFEPRTAEYEISHESESGNGRISNKLEIKKFKIRDNGGSFSNEWFNRNDRHKYSIDEVRKTDLPLSKIILRMIESGKTSNKEEMIEFFSKWVNGIWLAVKKDGFALVEDKVVKPRLVWSQFEITNKSGETLFTFKLTEGTAVDLEIITKRSVFSTQKVDIKVCDALIDIKPSMDW